MTALIAWLQVQLVEVRARASADGERGEVVEKVAIVVGMAALAATVVAAIVAAVTGKLGSLSL